MAILEEVLEDLYNKFGIYWETDISKLENMEQCEKRTNRPQQCQ